MELVLPSSGFEVSIDVGNRLAKLEILTDPADPLHVNCGFEITVKIEDVGNEPSWRTRPEKSSKNSQKPSPVPPAAPENNLSPPIAKGLKFASKDQLLMSVEKEDTNESLYSLSPRINTKSSRRRSASEYETSSECDMPEVFADLPENLTRKHTNAQFDRFLTKNLAKSMREFKKGNSTADLGHSKDEEGSDDSFGIIGGVSEYESGSDGSEGGGDMPSVLIEAMRTMTRSHLGSTRQTGSVGSSDTSEEQSSDHTIHPVPDARGFNSSQAKAKSHHQFLCANLAKSKAQLQAVGSAKSFSDDVDGVPKSESVSYDEEGGHDVPQKKVEAILRAASTMTWGKDKQSKVLTGSDDMLIDGKYTGSEAVDFPKGLAGHSAELFLPSVSSEFN